MTITHSSSPEIRAVDGGLGVVPGLRTAACASGVKPEGKLDLGVLVTEAPCTVAGVFTKNQAAAAPVQLCRELLAKQRTCRAVVVNSGNANALTGQRGYDDALAMVEETERLFGGPALPLSTGVIGVPLPLETILRGLTKCSQQVGDHASAFAEALLTTDTGTKQAARRVELGDGSVFHVGGVAKGSGMIHPNMATMLAILATDAPIASPALDSMLRRVTDSTFNRISVDGDTSTNDSVLALAQQAPGETEIGECDPRLLPLEEALRQVAGELAEQIVTDGEGATRVLEIRVHGARWVGDARAVAQAIAGSPLVKTALHGGDANWGRIIAAAGNAAVPFDVEELELRVGEHVVFAAGMPIVAAQDAAERAFQRPRVRIALRIGDGEEEVRFLTTDLSADYVSINAHYRT